MGVHDPALVLLALAAVLIVSIVLAGTRDGGPLAA
jgi:hypothetical protein